MGPAMESKKNNPANKLKDAIAAEVKLAQVVTPTPVHQPVALFDDADEDEYVP